MLLPRRKIDLDLSRSEEQSFGDVLPSISGSKLVPDTIHFPRDAVTTTSGSTRNRHFFVYIASKPCTVLPSRSTWSRGLNDALTAVCTGSCSYLHSSPRLHCYIHLPNEQGNTEQTCVGGDSQSLHLTTMVQPETTFYPDTLEGYLLLSLDLGLGSGSDAVNNTNSSTSDSGALGFSSGFESTSAGVLWNVSAFATVSHEEEASMIKGWTAYPATGLLLPGER